MIGVNKDCYIGCTSLGCCLPQLRLSMRLFLVFLFITICSILFSTFS